MEGLALGSFPGVRLPFNWPEVAELLIWFCLSTLAECDPSIVKGGRHKILLNSCDMKDIVICLIPAEASQDSTAAIEGW